MRAARSESDTGDAGRAQRGRERNRGPHPLVAERASVVVDVDLDPHRQCTGGGRRAEQLLGAALPEVAIRGSSGQELGELALERLAHHPAGGGIATGQCLRQPVRLLEADVRRQRRDLRVGDELEQRRPAGAERLGPTPRRPASGDRRGSPPARAARRSRRRRSREAPGRPRAWDRRTSPAAPRSPG